MRGGKRREEVVLVVRPDGIGDLIHFIPYAKRMRSLFRDHKMVLCCREESAELARQLGLWDDVLSFSYDRQRFDYFYRWRTLRRVGRLQASIAVNVVFHRDQIADELTVLSGAAQTIAFSGTDERFRSGERLRNNKFYTAILDVPDHASDHSRYSELLGFLGDAVSGIDDQRPELVAIADGPFPHTYSFLMSETGPGYFVIAPGATAHYRRWPSENFSALADRIVTETGRRIVLLGREREEHLLTSIARRMRQPATVCTDLNLIDAVRLIGAADGFAGNCSGPLHIAASLGVPAAGIVGGGHFTRYFPYGSAAVVTKRMDCFECNWLCIHPEPHCITDVTVEQVYETLRQQMQSMKGANEPAVKAEGTV